MKKSMIFKNVQKQELPSNKTFHSLAVTDTI